MIQVYFETSAADYFLSLLSGADAQATKELQIEKGRYWVISTTTLWEIMQIKKFEHYDKYLFTATFLFYKRLIKSPSELITDFIEKGCPKHHLLKNPYSECDIAKCWEKACSDRSYSFNIIGTPFIEYTNKFKEISRNIPFLIDYGNVESSINSEIIMLKQIIVTIYNELFKDNDTNQVKWLRKIALVISLLMLCLGYDIAVDRIEKFWKIKEITDPVDRLDYLISKDEYLLQSGPLWLMANVILSQIENMNKASRGALHDGLHSIYLPYIDWFFTKDKHFVDIRDRAKKEAYKQYYHKIHHLDEMEKKFESKRIANPYFNFGASSGR